MNRYGRIPQDSRTCGCGRENPPQNTSPTCGNPLGQGLSLAMAYVPDQEFDMLYTPTDALEHGTLFEALYLPYGSNPGRNGR